MSILNCTKCKATCAFKQRPKEDELFGAECDFCNNAICKKCAALYTTEAHALALTGQRNLLFYCPDCKCRLKDLPKFQKILKQHAMLA